jgi:hypothetical protein
MSNKVIHAIYNDDDVLIDVSNLISDFDDVDVTDPDLLRALIRSATDDDDDINGNDDDKYDV